MKKDTVKHGIWVLAVCAVVSVALYCYASLLDDKLQDEIKNNLIENSRQNVILIKSELNSQTTSIAEIAERIGDIDNMDLGETVAVLQEVSSRYNFKRMGVAQTDGMAYTTDNMVIDISGREYFQRSLRGEQLVSEKLEDYFGGEDIIVFSAPVYQGSQVSGVIFATYSTDILNEILLKTSYRGESYSYIVEPSGDIVSGPYIGDGEKNVFAILEGIDVHNKTIMEQLKNDIRKDKSGYARLYGSEESYIQYTSMEQNGWYFINKTSAASIDKVKNYVMNITYLLFGGVFLLFGCSVLYTTRLERKKNQQMYQMLYHDNVTGGRTYQYFCEESTKILALTERKAALLVMDIENFKLINEIFGYEKGDAVLQFITKTWEAWVKQDEIFARRTSDRYVILAFYEETQELDKRIKEFVNSLVEGQTEHGNSYVIRPKLGIYLIQNNKEDIQKMLNYASMAYSTAKNEKGLEYAVYDSKYKEALLEDKLLEDQMEQAYKNQEYIVYYQPKYDSQTKEIAGAEALVRWRKPDGTLIPPYRFIPIAEKSRFIVKLDQYIFEMVCRQQREWMDAGFDLIPISVNLSREHLRDENFVQSYQNIRQQYKVPISSIELEITESAIFENQEEFIEIVDKLHKLEFKILMDDFGTGYSSLMMLKNVHIDVMKLDKSFVDDYNDSCGEKVIKCVVQLAKSMDIAVTAEGVETKEQYEFLKSLGCDMIQGYYFAKPMPKEEFEALLKKIK